MQNDLNQIRVGTTFAKTANRGLIVCFVDPNGPAAVYEHVAFWQRQSAYAIDVLNLWPGVGEPLFIPDGVEVDRYSFIVFHPTCTYDPRNIKDVDRYLRVKMRDYPGIKVLVKQDEQHRSIDWAQVVASLRVDLVLTCLPPAEVEKVYPRAVVGEDVEFLQVLTGYVTDRMLAFSRRPFEDRRIDIGYRGSLQPIQFGRLGFEKQKIGRDVSRHAYRGKRPLLDISSRWEDRLGGSHWASFLGDCRIVLGAESGSNAFDLDGELLPLTEAYVRLSRHLNPVEDEYYDRACEMFLNRYEGNVEYGQVAPRHFEAAAAGSVQILYEGRYSDIFRPFEHFLPLKRDLSNLDDLLEQAFDPKVASMMTERVLDEIVHDRRYSFAGSVARCDEIIGQLVARKSRRASRSAAGLVPEVEPPTASSRRKAILMMAHEPTIDPRIAWVSTSLRKDFDLCEIGTYRFNVVGAGPDLERLGDGHHRLRIERNRHGSAWYESVSSVVDGCPAWSVFNRLALASVMDQQAINEAFGPVIRPPSTDRFRWWCNYFLNTNSALLEAASLVGVADVVVVADLEALPAGVAYAAKYGSMLVYDAHEYWPYSAPEFESWETEFWASIEQALVSAVDICCTVSPQIGELMEGRYGKPFHVVPNCAPLADAEGVIPRCDTEAVATADPVSFLFQGGFAAGRGIDLLIEAWAGLRTSERLLLRGPDNPVKKSYIDLARDRDVLERSVYFPPAVAEASLISTAAESDVGLISYQPVIISYRYCAPNKLSQYMAAGIPILAGNNLDFVKQIVTDSRSGLLVDFANRSDVAGAVRALSGDSERRRALGVAGRAYFREKYNWDAVSNFLFSKIRSAVSVREPAGEQPFDFTWIDRGRMRRLSSMAVADTTVWLKEEHIALNGMGSGGEVLGGEWSALHDRNSALHDWSTALSERNVALHDRNAALEALLSDLKTPRGLLKHAFFYVRNRMDRSAR